MHPLVSVIVPVYNVENYLVRCLDSLCKQSLREIEIILVDDTSPDCSGEICEEYAAKDTRFKVIHHSENRGLSAARNTGIQNATADYLMFVDSDDWVHEDFCKLPYECAVRFCADLVMFNLLRINGKDVFELLESKLIAKSLNGSITRSEAIELLFSSTVGNYAVNKLYHKSLFKTVLYPVGFCYEDVGTTYKLVCKASCIYYLKEELYYYFVRKNSITAMKTNKILEDGIIMAKRRYHDLRERGFTSKALEINMQNMALTFCIQSKRDYTNPHYAFLSQLLRTCDDIPAGFSWKKKILFVLFKYFPMLFEVICTMCGKKRL